MKSIFPTAAETEIESALFTSGTIDNAAMMLSENAEIAETIDVGSQHLEVTLDILSALLPKHVISTLAKTTKTDTNMLEINMGRENIWMDSPKFNRHMGSDTFLKKKFFENFKEEEGVNVGISFFVFHGDKV